MDSISRCQLSSAEMSAQLSRISHTLRVIFPGGPDELIGQPVIRLHTNDPSTSELHLKVFARNHAGCPKEFDIISQANDFWKVLLK